MLWRKKEKTVKISQSAWDDLNADVRGIKRLLAEEGAAVSNQIAAVIESARIAQETADAAIAAYQASQEVNERRLTALESQIFRLTGDLAALNESLSRTASHLRPNGVPLMIDPPPPFPPAPPISAGPSVESAGAGIPSVPTPEPAPAVIEEG